MLGVGFALFVLNILWSRRRGAIAGDDPWSAPTLEWSTESPPLPYNFAVPPYVDDCYPRWNPVDASAHEDWDALSATLTKAHGHRRETIGTSTLDARPEEIVLIERPSILPLATALSMTGALVDNLYVSVAGAVLVLGALTAWLWPIPHEEEGEE